MPAKRRAAIVFIHGLARKPPLERLQEIWTWGLARENPMPTVFAPPNPGLDLATQGVPCRFDYWADVFYGTDYETDLDSYYEANAAKELEVEALDRFEPELAPPQPVTPRERAFLIGFETKLQEGLARIPSSPPRGAPAPDASNYEIVEWLPDSVKQAILKKAAMEAYYFLFDKEYARKDGKSFHVRQELRARLLRELDAARAQAERLVVVSHSMGTMIAYDVLRNCPDCAPVETLFTLGSPLGVREIQEELIAADAEDVDFPAARLREWINFYDPLDPVCAADPRLANDYRPVAGRSIEDVQESNWGSWRHTITHYLAGRSFRARLRRALGLD